ncbi:MAG: hypothetical protein PVH88_02710 [Ignavibacteria bacterium]|jgi:hypothetical protein
MLAELKSLPPFTTKQNQKGGFMKALKSLILSIFLLSVLCVVSYGGGESCRCEQNGPGSVACSTQVYIPAGITFDWYLSVVGLNEVAGSYVASYALIFGPFSPIPTLYHLETSYYYITDEGERDTDTESTSLTYLYCGAEVGENNDGGSGASGLARVSW